MPYSQRLPPQRDRTAQHSRRKPPQHEHGEMTTRGWQLQVASYTCLASQHPRESTAAPPGHTPATNRGIRRRTQAPPCAADRAQRSKPRDPSRNTAPGDRAPAAFQARPHQSTGGAQNQDDTSYTTDSRRHLRPPPVAWIPLTTPTRHPWPTHLQSS